jgi:hypothetical protein
LAELCIVKILIIKVIKDLAKPDYSPFYFHAGKPYPHKNPFSDGESEEENQDSFAKYCHA